MLLLSIDAVDLVLTFVKSIGAIKNKILNSLLETLYLQQRVSVSAQFDCLGERVQNKKGPKSQKTKNYQFAIFDLRNDWSGASSFTFRASSGAPDPPSTEC